MEFKTGKDERVSPRTIGTPSKSQASLGTEPLPLPTDMDWPSLVDTATRVMMQVADTAQNCGSSDGEGVEQWDDGNQVVDSSITSG